LVLSLGIALVSSAAQAEELTKFTGYTRPGIPTGPAGAIANVPGGIEAPIGATVYFKVFELGGESPADPWGTGFKNLQSAFLPGHAARGRGSDRLDTSARYLYLYQVINDSYWDAQIKSTAVRLLVPPHLITSWGHFAERRDKGARGVGFSMLFDNPDPKDRTAKSRTLPVSTDHPGVSDALYRDPAPYFHAPRPYGLTGIQLNNKPAPLTDGEDTGREPERVVLQPTWNFEGAPNWLARDRVALPLSPYTRLAVTSPDLTGAGMLPGSSLTPWPMGGFGFDAGLPGLGGVNALSLTESLQRAPAVVAFWTDEPLKPGRVGVQPGQRSTIFGFTSNYPPVYEDVRVRGNTPAAAAGADTAPANLRADGEVPTPIAFEQCAPRQHALGSFGGPLETIGAGGGLLRGGDGFGGGGWGGGFGGGGFGGGFGGLGGLGGLGAGAGAGTGGGTGNGQGNGNGTSNGQQSQSQTLFPFPLTINNQNNNQDLAIAQEAQVQDQQRQEIQQQQQQEQQEQNDHHHHHHHHHRQVVPEPAAVVPALLGVPLLIYLVLRRRTAAVFS
jgi:hypothetical protein